MSPLEALNQKATQKAFGRMVGVTQPAISDYVSRGVLTRGGTYAQWLLEYSSSLRDVAAGRGGEDEQQSLTAARTEESQIKTALMRLDYHEKLNSLVLADACAEVIGEWCVFTNKAIIDEFKKFASELDSKDGIKISADSVKRHAGSVIERIQQYSQKLSKDIVGSGEEV